MDKLVHRYVCLHERERERERERGRKRERYRERTMERGEKGNLDFNKVGLLSLGMFPETSLSASY